MRPVTDADLRYVYDWCAKIAKGYIDEQDEVAPQLFLVYLKAEGPGIEQLGALPEIARDVMVNGSPAMKRKVSAFIRELLDTGVPGAPPGLERPDIVVQIYEGWAICRDKETDYDRERDGPISEHPDRGETVIITMATIARTTGGMVDVRVDAAGRRHGDIKPYTADAELSGRMVPDMGPRGGPVH